MVKRGTLKTGSIVTFSSVDYKLKANTVVNFDTGGVFSSFDAAVAATRNSGTLTVEGFTLTLINGFPVTINLQSSGTIHGTTPYTGEIKGTLSADVTKGNYIYAGSSVITLSADKKVKKATLKTGSIVTFSSVDYKSKSKYSSEL